MRVLLFNQKDNFISFQHGRAGNLGEAESKARHKGLTKYFHVNEKLKMCSTRKIDYYGKIHKGTVGYRVEARMLEVIAIRMSFIRTYWLWKQEKDQA